jgi:uncharacterized RDD family membrane protein YckC
MTAIPDLPSVEFPRHRPAELHVRMAALTVDLSFASVWVAAFLAGGVQGPARAWFPSVEGDPLVASTVVLAWLILYFVACTYATGGATPGKWLCGIRVASLDGNAPTLWQSLLRVLGSGPAPFVALRRAWTGMATMEPAGFHDRLARTIVVRD